MTCGPRWHDSPPSSVSHRVALHFRDKWGSRHETRADCRRAVLMTKISMTCGPRWHDSPPASVSHRSRRLGVALHFRDKWVDGRWEAGAPSKLNADHRRALAEVVEAGPVPAVDGVVRSAQGPGAVALGDVRHLARRDHGRARVDRSASPRYRRGRATTRKTSWPSRLLKKTSPPNWRRSGRGSRKASR